VVKEHAVAAEQPDVATSRPGHAAARHLEAEALIEIAGHHGKARAQLGEVPRVAAEQRSGGGPSASARAADRRASARA
jgi:hypothetical protein